MAEKGKEKVTWMKLNNFLKVKKALCSFPQIRDQAFDEKSNSVIIKVVCCSPEKIMNKLCSKGRGAIKRIETIDTPKSEDQKPKENEKAKEVQKRSEKSRPETGQSSQSSMMQAPMMGQQMFNGPYYYSSQEYEYPSRPIYHSYGGGGPPQPNHLYYEKSGFDYFSEENPQSCFIM